MAHDNSNTEPGVPDDIHPAEASPDAGMAADPMEAVKASDQPDPVTVDDEATESREADPDQEPSGTAGPEAAHDVTDEVASLRQELSERTDDLKRLHAEYVNYKRRVDRDRDLSRLAGIETVIMDLVPLLDDLRMARAHEGEFTGGLKLLAEELEKVAAKHGLESYGAKDDPFDPQLHDALMQAPTPGVTEPVCLDVMQVGYRLKGRVVRPARVAVAVPAE